MASPLRNSSRTTEAHLKVLNKDALVMASKDTDCPSILIRLLNIHDWADCEIV